MAELMGSPGAGTWLLPTTGHTSLLLLITGSNAHCFASLDELDEGARWMKAAITCYAKASKPHRLFALTEQTFGTVPHQFL